MTSTDTAPQSSDYTDLAMELNRSSFQASRRYERALNAGIPLSVVMDVRMTGSADVIGPNLGGRLIRMGVSIGEAIEAFQTRGQISPTKSLSRELYEGEISSFAMGLVPFLCKDELELVQLFDAIIPASELDDFIGTTRLSMRPSYIASQFDRSVEGETDLERDRREKNKALLGDGMSTLSTEEKAVYGIQPAPINELKNRLVAQISEVLATQTEVPERYKLLIAAGMPIELAAFIDCAGDTRDIAGEVVNLLWRLSNKSIGTGVAFGNALSKSSRFDFGSVFKPENIRFLNEGESADISEFYNQILSRVISNGSVSILKKLAEGKYSFLITKAELDGKPAKIAFSFIRAAKENLDERQLAELRELLGASGQA